MSDDKYRDDEWMEDELNFEEEEGPQLSLVDRLIAVFTAPAEVMADVKREPKPLLLLVALLFVFMGLGLYLQMDGMQELMVDQLLIQNPEMVISDELLRTLTVTSVVGGLVGSLLSPLIKAAFAHGLSILFGGSGRFKQTLGVVLYAYMITLLGVVIRSVAVFFTGNALISFSPAILMGTQDTTNTLYLFLSSFDIFNLWYLGVSVIGIKIVHSLSTAKAAVVVLLPWVVVILFSVLPNLMM